MKRGHRARQTLGAVAFSSMAALSGGFAGAQEMSQVNFLSSNDTSCSMFPQYVSQEMGFFAEEGIEINMLSSETTVAYTAFLSNGDADLAILDAAELLQAVDADQPVKAVYEACQYASDFVVVAEESPIQNVSELKGTTVGLASDSDRIPLALALASVELTLDDVSTVVVGASGPTLARALRDAEISAFAGSASDRIGIEAAGLTTRNITPTEASRNPCNTLTAWGPTLPEKRDMIVRFLRGWAKGHHAGVVDTAAVMSACKKRIPEQWEEPGAGEYLINRHVYQTQLRRTIDYGELQPDLWESIQRAFLQIGALDEYHEPSTFLEQSITAEFNDFTTDDVKRGINAFKEANHDILISGGQ